MRKALPIHKAVQKRIYQLIPSGEGFIEYPLPHHFADVIWLKKGIVFEVQCSYLSLPAAMKRTTDYEKLGFHIVWILHQKFFNRRSLSPTEIFLRSKNCYYTDITLSGHGCFYDQFETIKYRRRILRSSPLPIDLSKPRMNQNHLTFLGDRHEKDNPLAIDFQAKSQTAHLSPFKKLLSIYDAHLMKILKSISY